MDLKECTIDSYISRIYSSRQIYEKYGSLYCVDPKSEENNYILLGQNQAGSKTKRIRYDLHFCDQKRLDALGARMDCNPRSDALEYIKKLEISVQYNKPQVAVSNLQSENG